MFLCKKLGTSIFAGDTTLTEFDRMQIFCVEGRGLVNGHQYERDLDTILPDPLTLREAKAWIERKKSDAALVIGRITLILAVTGDEDQEWSNLEAKFNEPLPLHDSQTASQSMKKTSETVVDMYLKGIALRMHWHTSGKIIANMDILRYLISTIDETHKTLENELNIVFKLCANKNKDEIKLKQIQNGRDLSEHDSKEKVHSSDLGSEDTSDRPLFSTTSIMEMVTERVDTKTASGQLERHIINNNTTLIQAWTQFILDAVERYDDTMGHRRSGKLDPPANPSTKAGAELTVRESNAHLDLVCDWVIICLHDLCVEGLQLSSTDSVPTETTANWLRQFEVWRIQIEKERLCPPETKVEQDAFLEKLRTSTLEEDALLAEITRRQAVWKKWMLDTTGIAIREPSLLDGPRRLTHLEHRSALVQQAPLPPIPSLDSASAFPLAADPTPVPTHVSPKGAISSSLCNVL